MSPRSGRQPVNPEGCRPLRGLVLLFWGRSWGLRPRLYSATCFAGFGHNMLSVPASQVPGTTCLAGLNCSYFFYHLRRTPSDRFAD